MEDQAIAKIAAQDQAIETIADLFAALDIVCGDYPEGINPEGMLGWVLDTGDVLSVVVPSRFNGQKMMTSCLN